MKIILQILTFIVVTSNVCKAQTYVALSPNASASSGGVRDVLGGSIELGQQWGKWGLGFDIGKTSFSKIGTSDTTTYYEWRPFYTVYENNGLSHIVTLGYGKVLQAVKSNMFEVNYGIEMNLNSKIDFITFYVGSYFYWGKEVSSSSPFVGITLTKTLKKK